MYLINTRLMHGFLKELMEKIMVYQEHSLDGLFLDVSDPQIVTKTDSKS